MTDILTTIVFYIGLAGMVFSLAWVSIANLFFWLTKKPTKIKIKFPFILLLISTVFTFSSLIFYEVQAPAKATAALFYLITFIGVVISAIWLLIVLLIKLLSHLTKKSTDVRITSPLIFLLISIIFLFLPSIVMVFTATLFGPHL